MRYAFLAPSFLTSKDDVSQTPQPHGEFASDFSSEPTCPVKAKPVALQALPIPEAFLAGTADATFSYLTLGNDSAGAVVLHALIGLTALYPVRRSQVATTPLTRSRLAGRPLHATALNEL